MKDLLKKLAEIEGDILFDGKKYTRVYHIMEGHPGVESEWNPFESNSDALALAKKYMLDMAWHPSDLNQWDEEGGLFWEVHFWDYSGEKFKILGEAFDPDLNTAIVMAVVESHK